MIHLACLLSFCSFVLGFLLDSEQTVSQNTNKPCLLVDDFLAEKKELKHQINQLEHDSEQTVNALTRQIQRKFSILNEKIKASLSLNDTLELIKTWEVRYLAIEENNVQLSKTYATLQKIYNKQESALSALWNKSIEMEKKISKLEHLKSINQSLNLENVQNQLKTVVEKTNTLSNNQYARDQDFLALYNVTLHSEKSITTLDGRMSSLYSEITIMEEKVSRNSKQVAMTACGQADKTYINDESVQFPLLHSIVGINKTSSFKSTGKFICEIAGLYQVSAFLRSPTSGKNFYLKKNNDVLSTSGTQWHSTPAHFTSGVAGVATLQQNDTIHIQVSGSVFVYGVYSCVTIIKIK